MAERVSFDHLVLPVADLATARSRYEALGFNVAPEGRHPFGTANCCVFFADDSFLEPLAVYDGSLADTAIRGGNVFVGHDAMFRTRVATEGLSAAVVKTTDADRWHASYEAEGISGGAMLEFSRPFKDAEGREDRAGFKLAFAKDLRAPDALFFACERVKAPAVDRTALAAHPNGVTGLSKLTLTAPEPRLFETLLGHVFQSECKETEHGMALNCGSLRVEVLRPKAFEASCSGFCQAPSDPTLQFASITFSTRDLSHLPAGQLQSIDEGRRLLAQPKAGQGVPFFFEAAR